MNDVHFSRLKLMALSPAHYLAAEERDEDTPAKRFGSCVHVLALGGDVVRYDGQRHGHAWKAFKALLAGGEPYVYNGARRGKVWSAVKADAAERVIVTTAELEVAHDARELQGRRRAAGLHPAPIVTTAEYDRAQLAADVVRQHPIASELLEGEREVPLLWSVLGRACAGHVDVIGECGIHRGLARIVELKTSALAEPGWFTRNALRLGYHAQLDWYAAGARQNGYRVSDCFVVAVETRPPFAVTCLRATDRALEQGAKMTRLWMERLLACEAADEWPEYVASIVDFDVPDEVELLFDDEAA